MPRGAPHGIGIGWRPRIAADLLARPQRIDFVEIVAETCFAQPEAWREARALAELWPVVPHGVKLSLGSASGIDDARAKRLGELARDVHASVVTEHVALTRAGNVDIGHLTALPRTTEVAAVVARNTWAARRRLPDVPLLLENIATTLRFADDAFSEGAFYAEVVERTGCDLLLDVANLYANARNAGKDPLAELDAFPLDRVSMVHVAGGVFEDGFYFDTHAHPIPDVVFALLAKVFERCGDVPVVLERDANFSTFDELDGELQHVRRIRPASPERHDSTRAALESESQPDLISDAKRLANRQAELAALLTCDVVRRGTGEYEEAEVRRSRGVLGEKRIDDALPLLPRLASHHGDAEAFARQKLAHTPRTAEHVAIADAIALADEAVRDPSLEADARVDRLVLRARWRRARDGSVTARVGPFVGREALGARTVWVVKGPGANAAVRLFDGGRP